MLEPAEESRSELVDREPPPVAPGYEPSAVNRPVEATPTGYYSETVRTKDPRPERVVWFVEAVICSLIAIRFFMKLLGASMQADFVRFVYGVTSPLVAPFRGIFQPSGSGNYVLEPESLVAIAIYLLIGWALVALIRIVSAPRTRPTLP